MIVTDVNPLVYAFRPDTDAHAISRSTLEQARTRRELLVLPEVAAAFLRLTTDPRVTTHPDNPRDAFAFIGAVTIDGRLLREARASRWPIFRDMVETGDVRGKLVPDALLAATCRDLGAGILTADRDFLRFQGLRVHMITPRGLIDHTVT